MTIAFRVPQNLMQTIRNDLERPHVFAAERVGFISCRCAALPSGGMLLLAQDYYPVADADYVHNHAVGAMIGATAIRKAMQIAYAEKTSMFHIHIHHHRGRPFFSPVDRKCNATLVPDFFNASPNTPHGAMVLSLDAAFGHCWLIKEGMPNTINEISVVGLPTEFSGVWA